MSLAYMLCLILLLTTNYTSAQGNVVTDFSTSNRLQAQEGAFVQLVDTKYSPEIMAKIEVHKAADKGFTEQQLQGPDFSVYWDFAGRLHLLLNGYPSTLTQIPYSDRVTLIATGFACRSTNTKDVVITFLKAIPGVKEVIIPTTAESDLHMAKLLFTDPDPADSAFLHLGEGIKTADGAHFVSFRRSLPEIVPKELRDLHTIWIHTPDMAADKLGKIARLRKLQAQVADLDLATQKHLEILDISVQRAVSPYTGLTLVNYDSVEHFVAEKTINRRDGTVLYELAGDLPSDLQSFITRRRDPAPYSIALSKVPMGVSRCDILSALNSLAMASSAQFTSVSLVHVNKYSQSKVFQLIVETKDEFLAVLRLNRKQRIGNTFMLLSTTRSSIVGESPPTDPKLADHIELALESKSTCSCAVG